MLHISLMEGHLCKNCCHCDSLTASATRHVDASLQSGYVGTIYIRIIGTLKEQYKVLFCDLLRLFRMGHRLYGGHILAKLLLLYWHSKVLEHFSTNESSRMIIDLIYSVHVFFLSSATLPSLTFKVLILPSSL